MSTLPKPRVSLDEFKALQAFQIDAQRMKDQSKVPENTRSALDAFNNTLARIGYGTSNLLEGTNYPLTRLSYQWFTLISLYRDNWIASKLIDAVAEDMLKNWLNFTTELLPAKLKKIEQVITHTGTQDRVLQAVKWARLFGGAGAVMIIKGQDPSTPLDIDDIPLDSYRGLIVFDRWSGITPSGNSSTNLDRPLDFGLPEHYRVTTEGAKSFDVHSSRVLRFTGRIMPAWEFQADMRWGVSEIERVYTELKKRDNTSYNLASLIFRANIFELRQKGLASMISGISSGGQQAQQTFWNNIEAQTRLMSNQGIVVSDPEGGGLSTHQYGFSGIADVYVQFMLDICGACEIPFSRLFGRGASGLGQTGEGDEHVYYEMIGQRQKREINPQMMKLLPVIAMSTWGKVPADFEWSWNPVNSPTDKEKSDLAKSNTEAVVSAYNAGILWKSTAKKELKQQSSITQLFSNITDEEQEEAEDEDAGGGELDMGGDLLGEGGGKPKQLTAGDECPTVEHLQFAGFDVAIENPVGSIRKGHGWAMKMKHAYGYIKRTEGADGDAVDVFLGPVEWASSAYVIHTKNPESGAYDEDKIFLGFSGADDAIAAFYENYSDRAFLQGVESVPVEELPRKLKKYRGRMIKAYDAGFVESDHPRGSEGTAKGGQFVRKGGEGSPSTQRGEKKEGRAEPIPKAAAEQINLILARPEMKEKVINAYKNERKMGSIASTVGLPKR